MPETLRNPPSLVPPEQHIQIAAIVFPGMDQIDLTGPFAVLSRLPNSSFQLLWKSTAPVRDFRGLSFVPDATLADARPIDLLVVPGGPGQEDLMEDEVVLRFIAQQAERARCVFSVCTGSLICGAAGLLKERLATSHWRSVHLLKYFGAKPTDRRVVVDGAMVSAAGLTSGLDGALTVAALLRGDAAAQAIQLDIQYAPEPPFDCGSPEKAPAEMVAKLKQATEQLSAQRLATAKRVAARLNVRVED
jgi:cyclohexyl-isocyanide hydratase